MKKKYFILTTLFLILSLNLDAQKQSNRWYFGEYAGLDFSQTQSITVGGKQIHGLPTFVRGPLNTGEGSFSISAVDGKFLFASDGRTAYGSNNLAMPNGTGLLGHSSSAQSGIVVPVPESANLFYLITAPEVSDKVNGYRYSIVDMTLNNGNGDIVANKKNLVFPMGTTGYNATHTSENITAVKHTNDIDYWLVARVARHWLVWLVTKNGISVPKAYPIAIINAGYVARTQSITKLSPDGKKIINTANQNSYIYHADFEPSTGVISKAKHTDTGMLATYGIEFSPKGNYVYLTIIERPTHTDAYNAGLYIRKIEDLEKKQTNFNEYRVLQYITNVQLGPDRRIYAIAGSRLLAGPGARNPNVQSLYVIQNPDEGGTDIAEIKNFFKGNAFPRLGLPPFITSFFSLKGIKGDNYPPRNLERPYEAYLVQGSGEYEIAYLEWDYGDGSPKEKQNYVPNLTTYVKKHIYKRLGEYEMTVHPYNANGRLMDGSILRKTLNVREGTMIVNPQTRSYYRK